VDDNRFISRFAACTDQGNQVGTNCIHNGEEALEFLGLKKVGKTYEVNNRPL